MNMNNFLKRNNYKTKLIIILMICSFSVMGQNYSIQNRWTITMDYSDYKNLGVLTSITEGSTPAIQAELNYGLLNYLEIGVYSGYCSINTIDRKYVFHSGNSTIFYGANVNVHLMPFIIKHENFRFDFYVSGKFGGFYRFTSEDRYPPRGNVWDYGIYVGSAFYLGEHWGVFAEYGVGNYSKFRTGLSLKF